MRCKKLLLLLVLLSGSGLYSLQAQQAILASGSEASGGGGSVSYSVGQVLFATHIGINDYSSAEGVQQPYEIQIITGLEQFPGIRLECTVYPNPAVDILNLKVEKFENENLSYELYDMEGNILDSKEITNNTSIISMGKLPCAIYLLRVSAHQKEVKIFKIIKY